MARVTARTVPEHVGRGRLRHSAALVVVLAVAGLTGVTSCSEDSSGELTGTSVEVSAAPGEPTAGPAPAIIPTPASTWNSAPVTAPTTTTAASPTASSVPTGSPTVGTVLTPLTGLSVTVAAGYTMYSPEDLGDGMTQVTYAWGSDTASWSYLVVEGPGMAEASGTARQRAEEERQAFLTAGVTPSEIATIEWPGAAEAVRMTWNQVTTLPYASTERSVDGVGLWLTDAAGHQYVVVAYMPPGTVEISDAQDGGSSAGNSAPSSALDALERTVLTTSTEG